MIKSVIAAAEYSEIESFSGIDHSAYQETSAITNDFNHLSKYYVNFISTDLSAQNAMRAYIREEMYMRERGRIFGMLNGLHIWGEYIRGAYMRGAY